MRAEGVAAACAPAGATRARAPALPSLRARCRGLEARRCGSQGRSGSPLPDFCLPWLRLPGSAWSPPQLEACRLLDALERADRQVAWVHRNRHQTRLRRVAVLRVRAFRPHENPAVGLQGRHDFACGHAPAIISVTLCPVNRTRAARASAARRYCPERRQRPPHLRRTDGPLAPTLRIAAAVADNQAVRREAPAPCPWQAAARWRRGGAAGCPQLEDWRAVAVEPESLACVLPSALRGRVDALGWVVDGPNPVNRLELPKFKEARRKRATVAAEDVPRVLAALTPGWRPLFATAFFPGMQRGELLALQKEDIDLREWTMTVRRSGDADVTKGGDEGTVPIPEPLRPYIDAAIKLSPSRWVFPAAGGTQRATDTNLKAVLRRALGRAGIVEGYEHRCRKPGCGHVECADDSANRRCPTDGRALWIRPLPKKGIVFHSLRHTTATLLARAKVHPSVAQKILRHAKIETTLAIYTHLDGIEDMRAAVAKLDFGPLEERAGAGSPAPKNFDLCYQFTTADRAAPHGPPGRAGLWRLLLRFAHTVWLTSRSVWIPLNPHDSNLIL